MILKLNMVLEVVEVHVGAKSYQAKCTSSWVIVSTKLFAPPHNGEKSENPVLTLTFDI